MKFLFKFILVVIFQNIVFFIEGQEKLINVRFSHGLIYFEKQMFYIDYLDYDRIDTKANVKSLGPYILDLEYKSTENFGLSFNYTFSESSFDYTYLPNTKDYYERFSAQYQTFSLVGNVRLLNYFSETGNYSNSGDYDVSYFDPFVSLGLGYRIMKYNFDSQDPDFIKPIVQRKTPFRAIVQVGANFYFTKNFGINASLLFGNSSLLRLGVVWKINLAE